MSISSYLLYFTLTHPLRADTGHKTYHVGSNAGADPGGVKGVRTPTLLIRVPFFESCSVNKYHQECIKTHHFDIKNTKLFWRGHSPLPRPKLPLGAFGARPPVPLADGLDTRPCKIMDPPLKRHSFWFVEDLFYVQKVDNKSKEWSLAAVSFVLRPSYKLRRVQSWNSVTWGLSAESSKSSTTCDVEHWSRADCKHDTDHWNQLEAYKHTNTQSSNSASYTIWRPRRATQ